MDETLFSFEETANRREIAASLRAVTAALSGTGPLTLEGDDGPVTVRPSDPIDLEIEVERDSGDDEGEDGGQGERLELEIELGWRERGPREAAGDDESPAVALGEAGAPGSGPADDAGESPGDDAPEVVRSQATFEVFRDRADEWRWRLVHRNGNVIATSGEGYTTRRNAENGLRSVVENVPGAEVVDGL